MKKIYIAPMAGVTDYAFRQILKQYKPDLMYAEMDPKLIEDVIEKAIEKANSLGIKGKDTTPFLLDEIQKVTSGNSLEANIHLVYNNVKLACEIAKNM